MKPQKIKLVAYAAISLFFSFTCFAQNSDTLSIDDLYIDFAIPSISASNLLNIDNDQILQPGQLKELALALRPLIEGQGGQLALEWTPYLSIAGNKRIITSNNGRQILQYNRNYWLKAFQLSSGYLNDSSGLKMAFGFKWTPINKGDVLANTQFNSVLSDFIRSQLNVSPFDSSFTNGIENELRSLKTPLQEECINSILSILVPTGDISELPEEYQKVDVLFNMVLATASCDSNCFNDSDLMVLLGLSNKSANIIKTLRNQVDEMGKWLKDKKKSFEKESWNAASLHFSGGIVWESKSKNIKELKSKGLSLFAGYSNGIGKNWQYTIHGQYKWFNELGNIEESADLLDFVQDKLFVGGMMKRMLFNDLDKRILFQGSYSNKGYFTIEENEVNWKFTAGTEIKLMEKLWIEVAAGIETSSLVGFGNQLVTDTKLAYALGRK